MDYKNREKIIFTNKKPKNTMHTFKKKIYNALHKVYSHFLLSADCPASYAYKLALNSSFTDVQKKKSTMLISKRT